MVQLLIPQKILPIRPTSAIGALRMSACDPKQTLVFH
jgi:hypothetical protein